MWVFYLRRIHTEMNVWMGRGGGAAADTAMVVINRKLLTNWEKQWAVYDDTKSVEYRTDYEKKIICAES